MSRGKYRRSFPIEIELEHKEERFERCGTRKYKLTIGQERNKDITVSERRKKYERRKNY